MRPALFVIGLAAIGAATAIHEALANRSIVASLAAMFLCGTIAILGTLVSRHAPDRPRRRSAALPHDPGLRPIRLGEHPYR
jgi:hypothetical protein